MQQAADKTGGAKKPLVGFSVVIPHPGGFRSVLMGRRKKQRGFGLFACPGGLLEYGETYADGAVREVKEETGLDVAVVPVAPPRVEFFSTNWIEAHDHVVTLWFLGRMRLYEQQPQNLEPAKCEGWNWMPWATIATEVAGNRRQHDWFPVDHFEPYLSLMFPHQPQSVSADLSDQRRIAANDAFAGYDFGDTVIKDTGGWAYHDTHGPAVWRLAYYVEMPGGENSGLLRFVVRFEDGSSEVREAYVE